MALQPEDVYDESEIHSSSTKPVLDVTVFGTIDPEYPSSSFVVTVQAMVVQLDTVSLSYPYSVSKAVNVRITADVPVGAMSPDIDSEFQ